MNLMLELESLVGLGAVAIWVYFRYPRLRPQTLLRASIHLTVAFVAFVLLPAALGLLLPLASSHSQRVFLLLALLFPTLTYLLLSWVWLVARIVDLLDRTPRGGHPAGTKAP
jgi:CBS domain containing-hemolysin-like protein